MALSPVTLFRLALSHGVAGSRLQDPSVLWCPKQAAQACSYSWNPLEGRVSRSEELGLGPWHS